MSVGLLIFALLAETSSTSSASPALSPQLDGSAPRTPALGRGPAFVPPGPLALVPFSVSADRLVALPKAGQYLAEGHVVVQRGDALLRADRVTFDEARGVGVAEGHVAAVQGTTVLSCERVEMQLPELYGGLRAAELRIKDHFDLALADDAEPEVWRRAGRDQLIVEAEVLERKGKKAFDVEGATFTACDCGDDARPSWRIRSHSASIDLESGAFLSWPVFEIKNVPVFALPFFYVPLGERRSGLLMPRPSFSAPTGPAIAQPFYLVLGESADLTFEGRYLSHRGPGAALEARWVPSLSSQGELNLSTVLDYGTPDPLGGWTKTRDDPLPRFSLAARHRTHFSQEGQLRVDLNLLGDPFYTADFAETFLSRQAEYGASRVVYVESSTVGMRFGAQVQLLQDLRTASYFLPAGAIGFQDVSLFSGQLQQSDDRWFGPGAIRYRLLELRQDAFTQPVISGLPIYGGARLSAQAFLAPRPEISRFVRADLRPALRAPLPLPLGLVLEPEVALRLSGWAGRVEASGGESSARVAVFGRADLHLELMRDFGQVTHRIRPQLEYLLIPKVWGEGPGPFDTQDEVDLLGAAHQLRGRLLTDLVESGSGQRLLGLELWWGRDLGDPGRNGATGLGNSELYARLDGRWALGFLRGGADLRAAFDLSTRTLTEALLSGDVDLGRVSLAATYGRVGAQVPRYGFLATEELVPSRTTEPTAYFPVTTDFAALGLSRAASQVWSAFEGLLLRLEARPVDAFSVGLEAVLTFGDLPAMPLGLLSDVPEVRNTAIQLRWSSPCQCWGAIARAGTARDQDGFFFNFALDLARLGSVGTPAF